MFYSRRVQWRYFSSSKQLFKIKILYTRWHTNIQNIYQIAVMLKEIGHFSVFMAFLGCLFFLNPYIIYFSFLIENKGMWYMKP